MSWRFIGAPNRKNVTFSTSPPPETAISESLQRMRETLGIGKNTWH